MDRNQALVILNDNVKNVNLIKHALAVESVMESLAEHFGEDRKKWALTGLLHDIDYEKTKDNPQEHSALGAQMLENLDVDKEICRAILVHNEIHGIMPESLLEKSLYAVDPLTGLIIAAVLVLPSKKIADLTVDNVLNRFREKSFARNVSREIINKAPDYLKLSLADFIGIGLHAMQKISNDLGL